MTRATAVLAAVVAAAFLAPAVADAPPAPRAYDFEIARDWLTMPDGVRLSVTYFLPKARAAGERFPVLLELLPYRKDDSFYIRDYPLYSYFARRGFAMAKVDVRGTGSSEGVVPEREYSEAELNDAVEIIRQLARLPWSNGSVGMWGISWGGFNSLQVAMRRPPELKAILALHASDDLYHDDVRYIDGIYHKDEYELTMDHENALPQSPEYRLDEKYFEQRFNAQPWLLTYLKQQKDGPFWRSHSLRWQEEKIQIPVYLIGGQLDGYRDTPLRLLENLRVPVKAVMGPYQHDWPDNGQPGPTLEWRHEAVRWFNQWLRGEDTGIMKEPRLALFVR
ncbi:MAG: CocE/NonD family hydrolase, partial [Burkholderiales bacterium]